MADIKQAINCGCIVSVDYNKMVQVDYCLKHKAAPDMFETLKEIAEHKGRFSLDPLTHASNTIEDMTDLALKAIAKVEGLPGSNDKR